MPRLSKEEPFDVSDSTDWLQTPLPSLAPVDSALRCQVCRDFYNTPMITSCSHTFCSLCIRHCLNNDAKCPTCRKGDQESKLRNNYAVEDLVEAFKIARPNVMEHAKKQEKITLSLSPKRKLMETEAEDSSPVRKRTRAARRAQQSSQQVVIADSDCDDEDFLPERPKNLVDIYCPICQDGFPTVEAVQAHVDHCNGEPPSKKQKRSTQASILPQPVSKANAKRPERLPQLHYGMVRDNALKKKLSDLGISAAGSRQLMERRYTEWITLWNANCDSKDPKGKGELRKELDVWERTQGGGASTANRMNPGGNIRDKDFDGSAWSRNNDVSFRELVAQAKLKRAVKTDPEESPKPEAPSGLVALPPMLLEDSHTSQASASPEHPPDEQHAPADGAIANETLLDSSRLQDEFKSERILASPPGISSQRRFFADETLSFKPPSSQHQSSQILDKDIGISSELASLKPLQH